LNDHQLALRAVAGDHRAFETLLKAADKQLHAAIISVFQHRDEDLYQEVVLKVWEKLPTFAGGSQFATWAYQLARRHAIDRLRYQSIRNRTVIYTDEQLDATDEETPETLLQRKQDELQAARVVSKLLNEVSPLERDVLLTLNVKGKVTPATVEATRSTPSVAARLARDTKRRARKIVAELVSETPGF